MSRINTNVPSLIAQNVLSKQQQSLQTSLQRLSTGLQINSAKDNPAGLIAVENLKAEKAGTAQAITNAQRADNMIGTAEGALGQVSGLLTQLQTLVTDSANAGGLTDSEVAANQAQVDTILSSIDRIAGSTTFDGKNLLNGTLGYTTANVTGADLSRVQVNQAQLTQGVTKTVTVAVTTGGDHGAITYTGVASGGSNYVQANGATTFKVTGADGTSANIDITGNTETLATLATAVNAEKGSTGVSATVAANVLTLSAVNLGTDGFVSVDTVSGTFTTNALSDTGVDAVVTVDGQAAEVSGLNVTYAKGGLDVALKMTTGFADGAGSSTFDITGGGANFMLGGKVSLSNSASLGISSVSTGALGNSTDGYLASLGSGQTNSLSSGDLGAAQTVLDDAISQISTLRGKLGSFQKYTLTPTVNSLQVALENTSAAQSAIEDTDFAAETANLTRSQILSQAATSVLSTANAMPQSVLSLLRG